MEFLVLFKRPISPDAEGWWLLVFMLFVLFAQMQCGFLLTSLNDGIHQVYVDNQSVVGIFGKIDSNYQR